MIPAFRLCKTRYVPTAFQGDGARLYGGRWNSPGRPVIYTAASLSLATLEVMVHLEDQTALAHLFSWIPIRIPEKTIETIDVADLPSGWLSDEIGAASRNIGDRWLHEQRSATLAVPSVVTPGEWNYLLNPAHSDFAKIKIGEPTAFRPDPRL